MSYPINYPTPQGANVQIFYAGGTSARNTIKDWVKPQGASFVWFTLIGAGGGGGPASGTGGGSGAVTNFMGPAFLMPDMLRVSIGIGGTGNSGFGGATTIVYQQKDGTGYTLLTANGGDGGSTGLGAAASTETPFSAMGFFQSIAGQNGDASSGSNASGTTFLSGGGNGAITANYGYTASAVSLPSIPSSGYFQMQPIIVGVGGPGVGTSGTGSGVGGIGCGGGTGSANRKGGDGMVVIVTW